MKSRTSQGESMVLWKIRMLVNKPNQWSNSVTGRPELRLLLIVLLINVVRTIITAQCLVNFSYIGATRIYDRERPYIYSSTIPCCRDKEGPRVLHYKRV